MESRLIRDFIASDMVQGDRVDAEAMAILAKIRAWSVDDVLFVESWARDCDGVEGIVLHRIKPTLEAYDGLLQEVADDAEGPFCLNILSPNRVEHWRPYTRDRFAEQAGY